MIDQQKSIPNGVLNAETTGNQSDLPSSSEERQRSTSATSVSTPHQNLDSQPMVKSQDNKGLDDKLSASRLIQAFAAKLAPLVEWRYVTLSDGEEGWALFFSSKKWHIDEKTQELVISDQ